MRSSSSCRSRWSAHALLTWLLAAAIAASFTDAVQAIDPERAMTQYLRERWGSDEGFPGGRVYAIAQTSDGYLWIGADKGLVRFDGVSFRLIQVANVTTSTVLGLVADDDGSLWVRMQGPVLLRYRDGTFTKVTPDPTRPDTVTTAMRRGQSGAILFSAMGSGTLIHRADRFDILASSQMLPQSLVIAIAEGPTGDVWMGTRDAGLLRLTGQSVSAVARGLPDLKINTIVPTNDGQMWIGTDGGVVRWNGAEITTAGVPAPFDRMPVLSMTTDRDANLWVGTTAGRLLRLNARGVASVDEERGRGAITALFEDREGNLWIGGEQSIERVRDSAFASYAGPEGAPNDGGGPLYVDAQHRTWFAPAGGGLYWLRDGHITRVTKADLDADVVYSIGGGDGEVWLGRQRGGLTRLSDAGAALVARTYTQVDGLAQNSVYAVHRSRDGAVWVGTLSGGVSRLRNGRFTTYTTADGLGSNTITAVAEGVDGTMWFATPQGVSALSNGVWRVYRNADGLPSDSVNSLSVDAGGTLWIGTNEGIACLDGDRISVPPNLPTSLGESIAGIADDPSGALWIATATRVVRVDREALLMGRVTESTLREYSVHDGLRGAEGVRRHRSVVTDARGRVWFSTNRGVSVVDPIRVAKPAPPALVHVEGVAADGRPLDVRQPMHVAPGRQRIAFAYTGLSLSVPERVRFRYRLDGFDRGWSEPVETREAVYTNLGPGAYRFRVMASNSDGAWNGGEAMVGFDIEPAFWQTSWFRLAVVVAGIAAAWGLYRMRMRHVARQLNVLFEERLAERTRIAQELHDTLLQGFVSASMQLHVAADHLPVESAAKPSIDRVLRLMGRVIDEGRNAVRGLRTASIDADDLEAAFVRVPEELAAQTQGDFRVIVEGRPRPLRPVIRDEIYRIGREALVNAFRHANAASVEVELDYASSHVRLLVRDNGRGIDPQVLASGRDGHWGLSGMRERAERIGARFKVFSRAAAGTEIELFIPGHVAFQRPASAGFIERVRRLAKREGGWTRRRASK